MQRVREPGQWIRPAGAAGGSPDCEKINCEPRSTAIRGAWAAGWPNNPDMTIQEIQVMFQALSSLAIAGGLIYTAVQFGKNRQAQHFANFAKLVEMQMHLREMRVSDPSLAEVYRHDVEFAHSDREVREYFFNLMQLSVFEIVWYGHTHGQIATDYFMSWDRRMRDIVAEPSFRHMMGTPSMKILHDDFQAYVLKMVAETPERVRARRPRELPKN